ncbi:MAG: hypothetical protein QME64_13245, partial [bacterium]|nr:hypothetical protein [bacterium]
NEESPAPERLDYNDFYNPGAVNYGDRSGNYNTVSEINSTSGAQTYGYNIVDPPLFDSNYQLQSDSPCINTGHPYDGYDDLDDSDADMGYTGGPGAGASSNTKPAPTQAAGLPSAEQNFDNAVRRFTVIPGGYMNGNFPGKYNCFTFVTYVYTGKWPTLANGAVASIETICKDVMFTQLGVESAEPNFARVRPAWLDRDEGRYASFARGGLDSQFRKGYLVLFRNDPNFNLTWKHAGHAAIATGLSPYPNAERWYYQHIYAGNASGYWYVDEILHSGLIPCSQNDRPHPAQRSFCRNSIYTLLYTTMSNGLMFQGGSQNCIITLFKPIKPEFSIEFPSPYQY